jgi:hypothetical protein
MFHNHKDIRRDNQKSSIARENNTASEAKKGRRMKKEESLRVCVRWRAVYGRWEGGRSRRRGMGSEAAVGGRVPLREEGLSVTTSPVDGLL